MKVINYMKCFYENIIPPPPRSTAAGSCLSADKLLAKKFNNYHNSYKKAESNGMKGSAMQISGTIFFTDKPMRFHALRNMIVATIL